MVNMDSGAPSVRRMRSVTKKDLERLKKSGQHADAIKKQSDQIHETQEIPEAEEMLQNELKKIE